jgi:hypothetical protein
VSTLDLRRLLAAQICEKQAGACVHCGAAEELDEIERAAFNIRHSRAPLGEANAEAWALFDAIAAQGAGTTSSSGTGGGGSEGGTGLQE